MSLMVSGIGRSFGLDKKRRLNEGNLSSSTLNTSVDVFEMSQNLDKKRKATSESLQKKR